MCPERTTRGARDKDGSPGLEGDLLGAVPEHETAELLEGVPALHDREEVIAGQLADLAGEARAAVGEQDLRLADAAGIEEELAGGRVARVVLVTEPEVALPERHPGGLAAPARLDQPLAPRQQLQEELTGGRSRRLLQPRAEHQRPDPDPDHGHGVWPYSSANTRMPRHPHPDPLPRRGRGSEHEIPLPRLGGEGRVRGRVTSSCTTPARIPGRPARSWCTSRSTWSAATTTTC